MTGAKIFVFFLRHLASFVFTGVLDMELARLYSVIDATQNELPDNDEPFVWAPGVQLGCDFDVFEINAQFLDSNEPAVSVKCVCSDVFFTNCFFRLNLRLQASIQDTASIDSRAPSKEKLTIVNCLERSAQREQLSEHDMWYCRKCAKHVQVCIRFMLKSLQR